MTAKLDSAANDRGLGKKLKRTLPKHLFSVLRIIFNGALSIVPCSTKYAVASRLRRNKYPYRVIRNGDVVVQVGAPKDTLQAGRSRAMNFLKLVGNGKVIVVEPDECNCEALKRLSEGGNLSGRLVLSEKGAWSVPGTLQYLSNPNHPATNILKVVRESARGDKSACGYHEKEVPVDTLDNILASIGFVKPRLISITANGAEPEILKGLSQTLMLGVPFISLAATGPGYEQLMADLNYDMIALDDRGYTFARRDTPMVSD